MAEKRSETSEKSPRTGWYEGMRIFSEFVKVRRRDVRWSVFRFHHREKRFLVLSIFFVWLCMITMDHWYIEWVRHTDLDKESFFQLISPIGNSVWIFVLTGATIIFMSFWTAEKYGFRGRFYWQRLYHKVSYILLSVLTSGLLVLFLKNAIGRIRPNIAEENIFHLRPFSGLYDHAAFPSGHAATIGSLVCCVILLFPRLRLPALCIGTTIPVSRLMVEAHFPSDVLAGYLVGIAVSWYMALYYARLRLVFRFGSRGKPILRKHWKGNWKEMFATLIHPKY